MQIIVTLQIIIMDLHASETIIKKFLEASCKSSPLMPQT